MNWRIVSNVNFLHLIGRFFIFPSCMVLFLLFQSNALAEPIEIAPEPAIPTITNALSENSLVAIGERHGVKEMADFYLTLVADENFRKNADIIVLEIANARYQPLIDAYMKGEKRCDK